MMVQDGSQYREIREMVQGESGQGAIDGARKFTMLKIAKSFFVNSIDDVFRSSLANFARLEEIGHWFARVSGISSF